MPKLNKNTRAAIFKNHSIRSGINEYGYNYITDREGWNGHLTIYKTGHKKFIRIFNTEGKIRNLIIKIKLLKDDKAKKETASRFKRITN